jgi:hypothetical protein
MPLFRELAKNMAASYFGENYLTVFHRSETSVCTYSVTRPYIFSLAHPPPRPQIT